MKFHPGEYWPSEGELTRESYHPSYTVEVDDGYDVYGRPLQVKIKLGTVHCMLTICAYYSRALYIDPKMVKLQYDTVW